MKRFLCLRLAAQNLRRNGQTWFPFLLASSLLTFALYSLAMLALAPVLSDQMGATGNGLMGTILGMGLTVVGIFTLIFMHYADSFLLRHRQKELGLYAVLGMERRHIMRVQAYELGMAYLITLAAGLGLGMLLARLLFLVLRFLTRLQMAVTGAPSVPALLVVACGMGLIFLTPLVRHGAAVTLIKPIDLLHARQYAEKEPRARYLLAALGVICMGAGYAIALTVDNPMTAIALFFVAVLLVIAGTYLLFITTSVAVLKVLKNNKRFYYQPRHFITVSGMLYRVKQNAAGLASICILSTMAMVTLGTTSALYLGTERVLDELYPADAALSFADETEWRQAMDALGLWEQEAHVQRRNVQAYRVCTASLAPWEAEASGAEMFRSGVTLPAVTYVAAATTAEEYGAVSGVNVHLAEDEVAWIGSPMPEVIHLLGQAWRVTALPLPDPHLANTAVNFLSGSGLLLFPDSASFERFAQAQANPYGWAIEYVIRWDLPLASADQRQAWDKAAYNAAVDAILTDGSGTIKPRFRAQGSADYYELYGALLFIGVFLGLIFLMGTLLIIYFKQLSEGYQDHDRFIILQKVGMDQRAVKQTVHHQILMVFMAPLLVALCHLLGALPMLVMLLKLFELQNVPFVVLCTLAAAAVVTAAYLVFYARTARTYYKLVRFSQS